MYYRLFLTIGFVVLASITTASPTCRPVSIPVTASAENLVLTNLPNPTNATAHNEYLINSLLSPPPPNIGTHPITGTFTITAIYCRPPPGIKDRKVLQLMVHGVTYTKEMWAGYGLPPLYNWHNPATSHGYHTLAIDRLGGGDRRAASHPDPFQVVQGALEVEVLHGLITQLRSGIPNVIPPFPKIVYIGHSYGCTLGTGIAAKYPSSVDAFVLTGFSSTVTFPVFWFSDLYPAAVVGADIPNLAGLPYGYLTNKDERVRTKAFYGGAYDPAVARLDFARYRGVYTIGEASSAVPYAVATGFRGHLFLGTGDLDALFCAEAGTGKFGGEICRRILEKTRGDVFPGVGKGKGSKFEWYVARETGHTLGLHYSAPGLIVAVNKWLDGVF